MNNNNKNNFVADLQQLINTVHWCKGLQSDINRTLITSCISIASIHGCSHYDVSCSNAACPETNLFLMVDTLLDQLCYYYDMLMLVNLAFATIFRCINGLPSLRKLINCCFKSEHESFSLSLFMLIYIYCINIAK